MPKMTHPSSDHTLEVAEGQEHEYETAGWAVAAPASRPAKKTAVKKAAVNAAKNVPVKVDAQK